MVTDRAVAPRAGVSGISGDRRDSSRRRGACSHAAAPRETPLPTRRRPERLLRPAAARRGSVSADTRGRPVFIRGVMAETSDTTPPPRRPPSPERSGHFWDSAAPGVSAAAYLLRKRPRRTKDWIMSVNMSVTVWAFKWVCYSPFVHHKLSSVWGEIQPSSAFRNNTRLSAGCHENFGTHLSTREEINVP